MGFFTLWRGQPKPEAFLTQPRNGSCKIFHFIERSRPDNLHNLAKRIPRFPPQETGQRDEMHDCLATIVTTVTQDDCFYPNNRQSGTCSDGFGNEKWENIQTHTEAAMASMRSFNYSGLSLSICNLLLIYLFAIYLHVTALNS